MNVSEVSGGHHAVEFAVNMLDRHDLIDANAPTLVQVRIDRQFYFYGKREFHCVYDRFGSPDYNLTYLAGSHCIVIYEILYVVDVVVVVHRVHWHFFAGGVWNHSAKCLFSISFRCMFMCVFLLVAGDRHQSTSNANGQRAQ